MTQGVARIFSAQLQLEMARVLDRNIEASSLLLSTPEIGEVLIEAALMVIRSTAATVAGFAEGPEIVPFIYQTVTADVIERVRRTETESIARTLDAYRKRTGS